MSDLKTHIDGIFIGRIRQHWADKPPSAIDKTAVFGAQTILEAGFVGDHQADLRVHGGVEKAIHHYPTDHYAYWQTNGLMPRGTHPAAFGENLSSLGLTEHDVCIGDVFECGTAVLQISQGRQPCWKLGRHTQQQTLPRLFQETGYTGWYYRVLRTGQVRPGDGLVLVERPQPNWTVHRVTTARLNRSASAAEAKTLSELPELTTRWRAAFAKMAQGDTAEDTRARLDS